MKTLAEFIDALNEKVGFLVSWLTTLLVLVVCYDVFTRYALKQSSIAVQELEWHLFAVIFLVGAAFTLKHDRHVRVDVLYINFSEKTKAWINFFGSLVFLIPFSILVIWSSKNYVVTSFLIKETSPDPGGLPGRFLVKACIPLGFILVLLQGISLTIKSWLVARGKVSRNGGNAEHD
ncbi:TRAP transporter small permease subunit [candidate division KSB1 bacterium]|nr:TRAP transporter small permease subunit [candidate division KSB1 bacterium]NIR71753.1 TRAP transporter small permease subunit [candidate division KSB1 bacterium]NIS23483.1 TRAP transporter small permease subunit [candidate division KSB1 bacterium]NIT70406.1 TRAP transporter small permease subunit [candidate division KSB1 bacterium]NIU24106.1 TRAP transporter small permease subunit [candidate division KSB1 bacterium]